MRNDFKPPYVTMGLIAVVTVLINFAFIIGIIAAVAYFFGFWKP